MKNSPEFDSAMKAINKLMKDENYDELRRINSYLVQTFKMERSKKICGVKQTINIGSLVTVDHWKAGNTIYRVVDIKRTRAHLVPNSVKDSGMFTAQATLTAPISLIKPIK
jgi:hypothetical protein